METDKLLRIIANSAFRGHRFYAALFNSNKAYEKLTEPFRDNFFAFPGCLW
jgi:hypothetical protein